MKQMELVSLISDRHRSRFQEFLSNEFILFTLSIYVLWVISSGYLRYGYLVEILIGVGVVLFFSSSRESSGRSSFWSKVLLPIFVLQVAWSWAIVLQRATKFYRTADEPFIHNLIANIKLIGSDQPSRVRAPILEKVDIDGFLAFDPTGGIVSLLAPETPLIQTGIIWSTPETEHQMGERLKALSRGGERHVYFFRYLPEGEMEAFDKENWLREKVDLVIDWNKPRTIGPLKFMPANQQYLKFYPLSRPFSPSTAQ